MSDRQPNGRHPVAPRYRLDSLASDSSPTCDSSRPPVLVRLPNLDHTSHKLPVVSKPEPRIARPQDLRLQRENDCHGEMGCRCDTHRQPDEDRQKDTLDPPHQETAVPAVPEAASEMASRPDKTQDAPAEQNVGRVDPIAKGDWRSAAYKLGGAVVAVAMMIVVLLALNRRNDDLSSPVVDSATGADVLAEVPEITGLDAVGGPTVEASSVPAQSPAPAMDEKWLAENLSSAKTSVPTDSQPSDDPPPENTSIRLDPDILAAELPAQPPTHKPPQEYEQTPAYEQTPTYEPTDERAWADPSRAPSQAQLSASPETPDVPTYPSERVARSASPSGHANSGLTTRMAEPTMPDRFERDASPRMDVAKPPTDIGPQARSDTTSAHAYPSTSYPYPSTPYREMFPDQNGGLIDRGVDRTPVGSAQREPAGYPRTSLQQTDGNRAPARPYESTKPYMTGSYEHYR